MEPRDENPYEGQHFLAYRELPDGRLLAIVPLTFGRASLTLGPGGADYDGTFSDAWDFEESGDAVLQFLTWNPAETAEPVSWVRHTPSMRRRGEQVAEEDDHA